MRRYTSCSGKCSSACGRVSMARNLFRNVACGGCPAPGARTCKTVFAMSNGCARKILVYFHKACSANALMVAADEGEASER